MKGVWIAVREVSALVILSCAVAFWCLLAIAGIVVPIAELIVALKLS